jgi:hypothetical protein
MYEKAFFEQILATQVLILGKMINVAKEARGVRSTSDFTNKAASLIKQRSSSILEILR